MCDSTGCPHNDPIPRKKHKHTNMVMMFSSSEWSWQFEEVLISHLHPKVFLLNLLKFHQLATKSPSAQFVGLLDLKMQYWYNIDAILMQYWFFKISFFWTFKNLEAWFVRAASIYQASLRQLGQEEIFPILTNPGKTFYKSYQYNFDKSRARLLVCSSLEVKWAENEWV